MLPRLPVIMGVMVRLSCWILMSYGVALSAAPALTFAAMGDVPYNDDEMGALTRQLKELPAATQWVVHVGDIKTGVGPCGAQRFAKVAGILRASPKPLFLLPGDNEWNDCPEPEKAWMLWKEHFSKMDTHWKWPFAVQRQAGRDENVAFVQDGVLVMGITMVGGRVHDAAQWRHFLDDAARWVETQIEAHPDVRCMVLLAHAFPSAQKHKLFAGRFEAAARQWAKPILYIHGDGHDWIEDRPFKTAPAVLRVQLTQGGLEDPLLVSVDPTGKEPFQLRRRMLPSQ